MTIGQVTDLVGASVIKVGVVYKGIHISKCFKELACATDKWFRVISNLNSYTTKEVKNKAILSLNSFTCIAMWSLVTYFNCFVIYY